MITRFVVTPRPEKRHIRKHDQHMRRYNSATAACFEFVTFKHARFSVLIMHLLPTSKEQLFSACPKPSLCQYFKAGGQSPQAVISTACLVGNTGGSSRSQAPTSSTIPSSNSNTSSFALAYAARCSMPLSPNTQSMNQPITSVPLLQASFCTSISHSLNPAPPLLSLSITQEITGWSRSAVI